MPKQKISVGRILVTAVNLILIILFLLLSALLALSSLKGGTFELLGKSWHYYQSDVMTGAVERGEMLVINRDSPVTFHPDDIVAFYATDSKGSRVIQIARLMASEGTLYQLTEETGEPFVVDSTETVFIGRSSQTQPTSSAVYRPSFSLFLTTRSRLLAAGSVSWSWTETRVAISVSPTFLLSRT